MQYQIFLTYPSRLLYKPKLRLMPDELLDRIISDVAQFTFGSMKRPLLARRQTAFIKQ
jgi:hypothetical protein